MKKNKVFFVLLFLAVALTTAGMYRLYKFQRYAKEPVPQQVSLQEVIESEATPELKEGEIAPPPEEEMVKIPPELNLELPFYSQAPHGNWDYPWQEACEEASVLLVANAYFEHNWTVDEFNEEILDLVDWQIERFGDYEHTDMEQTTEILEDYLELEARVVYDPELEDVQRSLAQGHLLVMPFAGRQLGNPFFTAPGPVYHVLVVKGYTDDGKIITHDVGTRRGEDYVYTWEVVHNALHDYHPVSMENGLKRYIEVFPPETTVMAAPAKPDVNP